MNQITKHNCTCLCEERALQGTQLREARILTNLQIQTQSARAQKYIQRQLDYAQRQINYSQRFTQQFSEHDCPYAEQKVTCEAHRQEPEHCRTCMVWEREQFQKIKPINEGKNQP